MKVLIVHQYFKLPEEGSGIRSWYLARALLKEGHKVTVLSGHNKKKGLEKTDGFEVRYFKVPYHNRFGFVRRIYAFLTFVEKAKSYLRRNHDFDLLYVLTTPLTTGMIALYGKKKYGIDYVFEVGDLWPEVPIQLGFFKNKFIKKKLYGFEKHIYDRAHKLVGLSPAIVDYFSYTLNDDKETHLLPNVGDCDFFQPSSMEIGEFNEDNPLKIAYTGAIGYANQLEYMIEIARECDDQKLPVQFFVMGDGAMTEKITEQVNASPNIEMINYGGKNEVKMLLNNVHACYISYRNEYILTSGCPNKFMDGLASGKMIILNFGGWIKDIIEKNECGFAYDPENTRQFVDMITPFLRSPMLVEHYQANARRLAEQEYSYPHFQERLTSIIR